jgi:hypothetical protein
MIEKANRIELLRIQFAYRPHEVTKPFVLTLFPIEIENSTPSVVADFDLFRSLLTAPIS